MIESSVSDGVELLRYYDGAAELINGLPTTGSKGDTRLAESFGPFEFSR